ncbi:MAG: rod shape-determining protein RodA [Gammaproteobacteria bacterium]|nr:rod shape-determining protein RodA [Gammaproteobacteria bacterium]
MIARLWRGFTINIDGVLLAIVVSIVAIGMFTLYSATNGNPHRVTAQFVNLAVALAAMWLVAQVPTQTLLRSAVPVYLVGLALLVAVAIWGDLVNGARRWLHVGVTRIQPSEMMKIAMPLMLAWYFHRRAAILGIGDYAIAAVLLAVPAALIIRQPDLGTALLVLATGGYVIFLAGLSWRIILGVVIAGAASLPLVWTMMLHDYQRRRVLTLLDPSQDPLGAGYHTIQATIAVGSGGLEGKGWLNGTQTHLEFIPERHTDFIFAVFSEEFGLVGTSLLLVAYTALIARGLYIAANAPTAFSRLLAASITLIFFTYAFVNMGMVSGILPVVGVPLPFISYGGTALVTLFLGIGILMSVARERKLVQT